MPGLITTAQYLRAFSFGEIMAVEAMCGIGISRIGRLYDVMIAHRMPLPQPCSGRLY